MKINRKRLNNKGFTLVELLAVIVILALVMGITASYMISTMNKSKSETLHTAAQNAAATLNAWMADDLLETTSKKQQLGKNFSNYMQTGDGKDKWVCLNDSHIINIQAKKETDETANTSLIQALGLSEKDVKISGLPQTGDTVGTAIQSSTYTTNTFNKQDFNDACSAIRYNAVTNGYEVLLVATTEGKYYSNADSLHFAFNRASGPNELIKD